MYGLRNPSVGLLSNGEESGKGTDLTRHARELLRASGLNFIGYVEPGDVARGRTDIVVTDGFSGNLVLKTIEGTAHLTRALLRRAFRDGLFSEMGYWLARRAMKRHLGDALDYRERGGAALLGIDGLVIAAHGRSGARAITSALRQAVRLCDLGLIPRVRAALDPPLETGLAAGNAEADHRSDDGHPPAFHGVV